MKRFLILGAFVIAGTFFVVGIGVIYAQLSTQPAPSVAAVPERPARKLTPLPDVDALAARMTSNQDVYKKVRDEALADYAKSNPGSHPYDAEAQMTLRLAAYLWVWTDYYGEGLWRYLDDYSGKLHSEGCPGQIWLSLPDVHWIQHHESTTDESVNQLNACENRFAETPYPVEFKLWMYQTAIANMISAKKDKRPVKASLDALPEMATKAVTCFSALLPMHLPNAFLFTKGRDLLSAAQGDPTTLKELSEGIDRAFEKEDRYNSIQQVLDAQFYMTAAWGARGNGYADTVTPPGWKSFAENLAQAGSICMDLYAKDPSLPGLSHLMMRVVLGESQPRDEMELWFQRGLKTDRGDIEVYDLKEYYLLPRWFGSDEDLWSFGMECAQNVTQSARIPLILTDAIRDEAERDTTVYAKPELWDPVAKVYRDYLSHYPNSVKYRTQFAQGAVEGSHWEVAKEQLKILGDDWDSDVLSDGEYAKLMLQVHSH